ncbi:MAG: phasin family protein [Methyloceanibacter sp.]
MNRAREAAVDTMEKSFDAAGQGVLLDLAKSLAGAKTLTDIVELQAAYWRKQFGALTAQAEEVRALSTKVTADAGEPLKAHVKRGVDELGRGN